MFLNDGKLLIKPSAKNVKAFLGKVRETIRENCSIRQETLINLLNPMIRGWANYHRHVVAKTMYSKVDHHIWQALWRWARRRHPNKSNGWVQRRYFRTIGSRRWIFATATRGRGGEAKGLKLYLAKETRIIRHVKVKSKANPFDPAWNSYFAQRKRKGMLARLHKPSLPMQLWQEQQGQCPVCTQLIEEDDRWAIQPGVPLQVGDDRSADKLRMLHSSCLRSFRIAQRTIPSGDNRVPAP